MSNDRAPASKKVAIQPITFVIEVTADKLSEKGTFSGIKSVSIKSDVKELQGQVRLAAPPSGGGSMFLITDTLKGVKVLGEVGKATKPERKKLF